MRSSSFSTLLGFTILSLLLPSSEAFTTRSWLTDVLPQKGATISDELKCYSLPYGGIGFLSHVLTYWTILCLGFGRKPYWPWSRLSAGKFDLCLSCLQLLATISIAILTIARCRSRWQFVCIAVWKLVMSLTVGIWSIRASVHALRRSKYALLPKHNSGNPTSYDNGSAKDRAKKKKAERIWSFHDPTSLVMLPYAMAATSGLVGLLSIVAEHYSNPIIKKVTIAFGSVVGAVGGLGFIFFWIGFSTPSSEKEADASYKKRSTIGSAISSLALNLLALVPTIILILTAFYSDWILGALAGSLVGVPSGDNAMLYWTYFAAKRLPLFLT